MNIIAIVRNDLAGRKRLAVNGVATNPIDEDLQAVARIASVVQDDQIIQGEAPGKN